nr:putative ORF1 [Marmot picobirnavirus]
MTANQIAYWNYRELVRSNQAKELETNRSNRAREEETHRANVASETETQRHAMRTEDLTDYANRETSQHNRATEQETAQHNRRTEALTQRQLAETELHNRNTEQETSTHNRNTEQLTSEAQAETARHNAVNENIAYINADPSLLGILVDAQRRIGGSKSTQRNINNALIGAVIPTVVKQLNTTKSKQPKHFSNGTIMGGGSTRVTQKPKTQSRIRRR